MENQGVLTREDLPGAIRLFPLRVVLTVTTGRLLTERRDAKDNGISDVYEILGHMTQEPREIASSGLYFLGGKLRTYDEVVADNDPQEAILRANMRGNEMWVIVQNDNSWRFTGAFSEQDCIVDGDGRIVRRGNDADLVAYRQKKTAAKNVA